MSDQEQAGSSGVTNWRELTDGLWYMNPTDKHTKTIKKEGFTTATSGQSLLLSSEEDINSFKSEIRVELNPINALQELCVARHFSFPKYTFYVNNIMTHNPTFNVVCSISIYVTSGTDSTKKGAKKKAAHEMYKLIKRLDSDKVHDNIDTEREYKDASPKTVSFCHESVNLLKTFFGSTDELKMTNLKNAEKNSIKCKLTAFDTLRIISEIENITLSSVVLSQNSDKVEVMMQANTPLVMISESGKNQNDAQESAASSILEYFKLNLHI
eukprot:XP_016658765.1 PREDICTED: uncharacterized protein LOC107883387 [Acyrthosiphon pisum]